MQFVVFRWRNVSKNKNVFAVESVCNYRDFFYFRGRKSTEISKNNARNEEKKISRLAKQEGRVAVRVGA